LAELQSIAAPICSGLVSVPFSGTEVTVPLHSIPVPEVAPVSHELLGGVVGFPVVNGIAKKGGEEHIGLIEVSICG